MNLSRKQITVFQLKIWKFYKGNKRDFLWRHTKDPYKILVSEIMLQQTQTKRAEIKYKEFLKRFPTITDLAATSKTDILKVWQGLGYNRRALFLHKAAQSITEKYNGKIPNERNLLLDLPGIGEGTAGAMLNYAFEIPTAFVETNIRSVFIHDFFKNKSKISDKDLLRLVEQTLDRKHPKDWFYALTDYGVYLKSQFPNPSRKSKHYTKQSKFEGSNRQKRSKILKALLERPQTINELIKSTKVGKDLINKPLKELIKENFVIKKRNHFTIIN